MRTAAVSASLESLAAPPLSKFRLVRVPVLLTLLVTIARLAGEVLGGPAPWFSTASGGGQAWVGIVWLPLLFGPWFGWRLARAGEGPRHRGVAIVLHLVACAAFVGTFVFVHKFLQPDTSTREGLQTQILVMCGGSVLAALIALPAWPALFGVNLLYGLLARLPVVAITFTGCAFDLGTHYEKLGPNDWAGFAPMVRAAWLSLIQLTEWPASVIVAGGLLGSLAALVARPRATT